MLQHIHEHCQRVMLLMATRPIKDYNVTFIKDYQSTGAFEEIALNGLGETEIGEIILQNFDRGVHTISPEIIKVVQVCFYINRYLYTHTYFYMHLFTCIFFRNVLEETLYMSSMFM